MRTAADRRLGSDRARGPAKRVGEEIPRGGADGENPAGRATILKIFGALAQLGEHHVRNVGVEGSNPLCSTKQKGHRKVAFLFCCSSTFEPTAGRRLGSDRGGHHPKDGRRGNTRRRSRRVESLVLHQKKIPPSGGIFFCVRVHDSNPCRRQPGSTTQRPSQPEGWMAEYDDDEPGTAQRVVGESNITALRREAENPLCSTKQKGHRKVAFLFCCSSTFEPTAGRRLGSDRGGHHPKDGRRGNTRRRSRRVESLVLHSDLGDLAERIGPRFYFGPIFNGNFLSMRLNADFFAFSIASSIVSPFSLFFTSPSGNRTTATAAQHFPCFSIG